MTTLDDFIAGMKSRKRSVILLEGTRNVPDQDRLIGLGKSLTALLPEAVFRSGNAPGADEAFSRGVWYEAIGHAVRGAIPFSSD